MFLLVLAAATAAAPAPTLRPELEPMRFLVGHCWRGERSPGMVDTHCFEPVYDGKHIRDRHKVPTPKGNYEGETLYSWNAKVGRIDYVYWNSFGQVMTGDAASDGADGLAFNAGTIRWRRLSPTSYEVTDGQGPAIRFERVD
jgi:hypothetical protein